MVKLFEENIETDDQGYITEKVLEKIITRYQLEIYQSEITHAFLESRARETEYRGLATEIAWAMNRH